MRGPQPWRTNRARVLRSHSTSAEDRIWSALRNRRLNGLKFVRQSSIGPYFVDFVCRERMIIVEIDGATHSTERELSYDAKRADYLRGQGYRIFCANNGDVYENLSGVLTACLSSQPNKLGEARRSKWLPLTPTLSPQRAGRGSGPSTNSAPCTCGRRATAADV